MTRPYDDPAASTEDMLAGFPAVARPSARWDSGWASGTAGG